MRSVAFGVAVGGSMLRAAYRKTRICGCGPVRTAIIRALTMEFCDLKVGAYMRVSWVSVWSFFLCLFGGALVASAQLPSVKTDPLHPAQMIQGSGACSATEPSSCAQAAAKITPIVLGESPLEDNLRRLTDEIGGRVSGSAEYAKAVQWGIAGFRVA